jgi:GntP family gluconate:H+ symporter
MATTAMLLGLPLFFEIGFVLLLPLAKSVARRLQEGPIRLVLALLAGLSAVHCLVPPHPGPLLAIHIYGADTGKTLLYGLIAALPAVILAGIVYGGFIARRLDSPSGPATLAVPDSEEILKKPAGAGIALATLLVPVVLMLLGMLAPLLNGSNPWHGWLAGLGEPVVALLTALLMGMLTLGATRGLAMDRIRHTLDASLAPIAAVLLLIGAGGGLKQMLVDSGVGAAMGRLAMQLPWSPLVLAYMVAALIRLATGSATVATITGAGLMAPVAAMPGSHRELLVLAPGSGSLIFSHVNDAGFWMVKGFLSLSLRETLLTWTAIQTILSLAAMTMVLVLAQVIA